VTTTQVSQSTLISAPLGDNPAALTEDISLATPRTLARNSGRAAVVAALGACADVIGGTDADLRLEGRFGYGSTSAPALGRRSAQSGWHSASTQSAINGLARLDCALHQQRAHILARRILETEAHLAPCWRVTCCTPMPRCCDFCEPAGSRSRFTGMAVTC
jgi:hypothetical protein